MIDDSISHVSDSAPGRDPGRARVRFASYINEDTGETTRFYLYSYEDIDAEIDRRIREDMARGRERTRQHEATRAKFHAVLRASAR